MLALLTYTYGARNVATMQRDITQKEFNDSRTKTLQNEVNAVNKWVGKETGLSAATLDEGFSDKESHSATNASDHLPGQRLAVAVVATPVQYYDKGRPDPNHHRVDMFPSSIQVSGHTKELTNNAIKEKMISANDAMVNEELTRLNEFLRKNGAAQVDNEKFVEALKTGDVSVLDVEGLKFSEPPKFLETRAMVNGNICNNLTYMIGMPNFAIE